MEHVRRTIAGNTQGLSAVLNIHCYQRNGQQQQITVDREPDACPICHRTGSATPLAGAPGWLMSEGLRLQRPYRCPSQSCEEIFIAEWEGKPQGGPYLLAATYPARGNPSEFSAVIQETSPDFVAIYNQAEEAERQKLTLVCGPGYRKALEFLMKDYVIKQNAADEPKIKGKLLGAVINEYVDNKNIKTVAARAVWLGNDETHYERKWETKDLADLKRLIHLTVHWIEDVRATEEIEKEMPASGPPEPTT